MGEGIKETKTARTNNLYLREHTATDLELLHLLERADLKHGENR